MSDRVKLGGTRKVPGYAGIGSVTLEFRKRKAKRFYGLIMFLLVLGLLVLRAVIHNAPGIKNHLIVPILRPVAHKAVQLLIGNSVIDDGGSIDMVCEEMEECYRNIGRLHATHRLIQMEVLRSMAFGRLSEIFGEEYLETDHYFRLFDIDNLTKGDVRAISTKEKKYLESYSNGVNSYISHHPWSSIECRLFRLPPSYHSSIWTASDTLAIARLMMFLDHPGIDSQLFSKFLKSSLITKHRPILSTVAFVTNKGGGAGKLFNEIFSSSSDLMSNGWMKVSISSLDNSLQGLTVPGIPFVMIGQNKQISWGISTHSCSTIQIKTAKRIKNRLMIDGDKEAIDVTRSRIKINVRDIKDVITEKSIDILTSSRGAIIPNEFLFDSDHSFDTTAIYLISSAAMKAPLSLLYLHELNYANSFESVKNSLSISNLLPFQVFYMDTDRNIGSIAERNYCSVDSSSRLKQGVCNPEALESPSRSKHSKYGEASQMSDDYDDEVTDANDNDNSCANLVADRFDISYNPESQFIGSFPLQQMEDTVNGIISHPSDIPTKRYMKFLFSSLNRLLSTTQLELIHPKLTEKHLKKVKEIIFEDDDDLLDYSTEQYLLGDLFYKYLWRSLMKHPVISNLDAVVTKAHQDKSKLLDLFNVENLALSVIQCIVTNGAHCTLVDDPSEHFENIADLDFLIAKGVPDIIATYSDIIGQRYTQNFVISSLIQGPRLIRNLLSKRHYISHDDGCFSPQRIGIHIGVSSYASPMLDSTTVLKCSQARAHIDSTDMKKSTFSTPTTSYNPMY